MHLPDVISWRALVFHLGIAGEMLLEEEVQEEKISCVVCLILAGWCMSKYQLFNNTLKRL